MRAPSRRAAAIRPSLIRRLFDARRPSSVNLGLGEPALPIPMELLDAGLARYRATRPGYTPNAGLVELRERLVAHYDLQHARAPRNAIVTVGLQEALFSTLLAITDPGDEILLVEPAFVAYRTVAELLGLVAVAVPMAAPGGFPLDPAALARAITPRTRAILINSPSNPTGRIYDAASLAALVELTESSGVWLISDEVYGELYYGAPPATVGALSDRAIVLGALSKSCSMTGFRLGWVLAPDAVATAIAAVHQFNVTCAPTVSQLIALEAFTDPARWLASLRAPLALQRTRMLAGLAGLGLAHVPCDGGFFAFVDVAHLGMPSLTLAERLLDEADVVTVPGSAFGQAGEGFLRLSFAGSASDVDEGLRRIGRFVEGLASR